MPHPGGQPAGQIGGQPGAPTLDRLTTDLAEQGRRVQGIVEAAFAALFARDADAARRAIALDDPIDAADVRIEQGVVGLLTQATRAGASIDERALRWLITVAKVNNELERIADCGVDVAELCEATCPGSNGPNGHGAPPMPGPVPGPAHGMLPAAGSIPDTFRVMANSVIGLVRDACLSVDRRDPALARVVLQSQHAVWAFKQAILREAERGVATGMLGVDFAFNLHEIASQCEIIADHCTNIAEQVIYVTTGAIVRHEASRWVEVPGGPGGGGGPEGPGPR